MGFYSFPQYQHIQPQQGRVFFLSLGDLPIGPRDGHARAVLEHSAGY